MPLNPQVEALLAMFAALPPPDFATMTAETMRAMNDRPLTTGSPPHVDRATELSLPLPGRSIAARLYIADAAETPPPLILYCHGGGWVIGTLDTHDATCRALARSSGAAVLSIAYRLAPEHPFPAGLDDCVDALRWAYANGDAMGIDASRLAVAGDSAGGNLAAATAIRVRGEGGPPIRHQLLLYPVTDRDFSRASYVAHGGGDRFLSTAAMQWFWNSYLGDRRDDGGHAAVLRFPDLAGLPPATLIAAEYDPLCDEGMAYAARLADAGVPIDAMIAPGMIHGFVSLFQAIPDAMPWIEHAGARLRDALA